MALQRGSTGNAVRTLQMWINAYAPLAQLTVDGNFGPLTEAALKNVQLSLGLQPTGIFDAATEQAMLLVFQRMDKTAPVYSGTWSGVTGAAVGATSTSTTSTQNPNPNPKPNSGGFLDSLGWNRLSEGEKTTLKFAALGLVVVLMMPRD